MKFTSIGSVSLGIDGSDSYVLTQLEDDDFVDGYTTDHQEQEDLVRAEAEKRWYRESTGPGSHYCTAFEVIRRPYTDDFILIIKGRYDV